MAPLAKKLPGGLTGVSHISKLRCTDFDRVQNKIIVPCRGAVSRHPCTSSPGYSPSDIKPLSLVETMYRDFGSDIEPRSWKSGLTYTGPEQVFLIHSLLQAIVELYVLQKQFGADPHSSNALLINSHPTVVEIKVDISILIPYYLIRV